MQKPHIRIQLLLISILLNSACAVAQQYCPMPDSNMVWKCHYVTFSSSSGGSVSVYDDYIAGDTVISATSYKKIYAYGCTYSVAQQGCNQGPPLYVGALRDDSIARKVYFRFPNTTADTLLIDFNITVGQPIPYSYVAQDGFVVTSVDSIRFGNKWHRCYHTGQPQSLGEYMLIEGLGATSGLRVEYNYGTTTNWLDCAYYDNRPAFPDTLVGCVTLVGIADPTPIQTLTIAPNPASSEIMISLPSFASKEDWVITITDINGAVVKSIDTPFYENISIGLEGFSACLYTIICTDAEQRLIGKLVVLPD